MATPKIPILMLEPLGPQLSALRTKLKSSEELEIVECMTPSHVADRAEKVGVCLVLAHVVTAEDGLRVIGLLEKLKDGLRTKSIRVMVTSELKDPGLEKKIEFAGCSELIGPPFAEKGLQFKVELHVKALPVQSEVEQNFSLPLERLGAVAGTWGPVELLEDSHSMRVYIYIPQDLLKESDEAPPFRDLPEYWTYLGHRPPYVEKNEWLFPGRRPVSVAGFRNLARPIQQYLEDRFSGGPVAVCVPKISPLAMAFLVSELMANLQLTPEAVASRACAYLSSSLQGRRAELWVRQGSGQWLCPGTSDSTSGVFDPGGARASGRIEVEIPRQKTAALLVVEEMEKGSLPEAYLQAISRIFSGLASSYESQAA